MVLAKLVNSLLRRHGFLQPKVEEVGGAIIRRLHELRNDSQQRYTSSSEKLVETMPSAP